MKIREDDTALRSSWEASEKRQQTFKQITEQIESRSASKHLSETSRLSEEDSRKSSSLQSQTGMKNQKESASFVSQSVEKTQAQRSQDVTNIALNVTNVGITHSTNVETTNYTQVSSGRIIDQGSDRISTLNPIQEARERDNRLNTSTVTHKTTEISYFQEQNSGDSISEEERGYRSSRPTMTPPSRQLVDRGSFHINPVSGIVIQEVPAETSQSSSSAIYTYSEETIPDDNMGSAQRLEESSEKFVGEYIDMAWNEALTSTISNVNLDCEDETKKKASSQSGSKGPSDEMWDVRDPSAKEPRKIESPKDSEVTKNTVVKRSGRSLWGIISDVVQLRWGPRSETPKSTKRSSGKSSSNNSVTSETWFSGHDPEETSDKNGKKERGKLKEATSSHHRQPIQGEVSGTLGSKCVIRQLEPGVTSPSTTYISGSTSKGVSSPMDEYRKSLEGTQSLDGKSSLVSLPSSSSSAFIGDESYGRGRADVSVGGAMEIKEQPLILKPTEVSGSEGKYGELKQRKLQRNKQVVKDKFDEWEEAYTRESEQRRIDEMFMREALVEAKKAADTWEVPVGAVLVQHGKIIARGYNLVEELRDSTAHAEMICIREASNQLRSWRLAESTLYVTLEPCAMCAGAILQARIDTLVWGAPNKLLGADGSWIRLFPSTEGGDKPAAPPHPFHPKMTIRRGILESECADAMQQFFQLRRRTKAKDEDSPPQPSLPIATHQSKFLRKMHDIFHAFLCL